MKKIKCKIIWDKFGAAPLITLLDECACWSN